MLIAVPLVAQDAQAQYVDDGSDKRIGQGDARLILDLVGKHIEAAADAKVTELRRSAGSWICGSVNVKNRDGLYIGERGFVVDHASGFFGRVPEGPELMNPRVDGFGEKERIRALYFEKCLD